METEECEYCVKLTEDKRTCEGIHKEKKYFCTRERGHEGEHVACGGLEHYIEAWNND